MVRRLVVGLLIASIAVLPRIPMSIVIPSRRFDLRVEDIILVVALFFLVWQKMRVAPVFKAFGVYLLIGAAASIVGILAYDLDPARATFYVLKEVEFGLLGFLIANWVRTQTDLKWALAAFFVAVVMNAAWIGFQVATDTPRPLFVIESDIAYDPSLPLFESYGPGLISEVGAFQTGQFFLFAFLLAFAYAQSSIGPLGRWFYVLISLVAIVAIVLSASRGAIFGAIIGVAVLLRTRNRRTSRHWLVLALVLMGLAAVLALTGLTTPDRFQSEMMEASLLDRMQNYWFPLISSAFPGMLVGLGKGALGFAPGLDSEFAHNNYLRILIESGLCGLIAFLWVLSRVLSSCWKAQNNAELAITKSIAGATLAVTIARMIQAFTDDVFAGVLVTELWWIFVGLTVAAYQVEGALERRVPVRRVTKPAIVPRSLGTT